MLKNFGRKWIGWLFSFWQQEKSLPLKKVDLPAPTKQENILPRQQYVLRGYTNGGQEIIDTIWCLRKITYNTGDIVWMKNDQVIVIQPYDMNGIVLKYTDDNLARINSISFPKLTHETETHLRKQEVFKNLEKNSHHYDMGLMKLFDKWNVQLPEVNKAVVLKFFNITAAKEK